MLLADILTSAASWDSENPLLTYTVPDELESALRCGQLVAAPYGERLVEGIVWAIEDATQRQDSGKMQARLAYEDTPQSAQALSIATGTLTLLEQERVITLRPLNALLDPEPALQSYQMRLAEWIAHYYLTPLAQVAFLMLPPGLVQRSQAVLHLVKDAFTDAHSADISPRLRSLIGLLLEDGELDVEQLKQTLGPKKAREILKEALSSGLITRDAQLQTPRTKKFSKRVVRLLATTEVLTTWREGKEAIVRAALEQVAAQQNDTPPSPADQHPRRKRSTPDPWAIATPSTPQPVLLDRKAVSAQRQLTAIDLLQHSIQALGPLQQVYWTPGMLCKASHLTAAQLRQLEREKILRVEEEEIRRDPLQGRNIQASMPLTLTAEQRHAVESILTRDTQHPILLHGVTGSGKTEVYLQALAALIQQGKRGIILVPEIALTTQAVQRVAGRFPGRVAIIHSALSDGERYDEWRRIRTGEVDIVIGSRSALFAPVPNLGIIIIDEEHETAYKQSERRPTYHAREAALQLGRLLHIPVVLGSATPSVETYYRATQGDYHLVELPGRIGATLPPVEIVDLRSELLVGNTSILSRRLQEELERVLSRGQQAILFLNRRGEASVVLCRACGFTALCRSCDIPLTYHSTESILLCHYCGTVNELPSLCPACHSAGIRYFGLGTEKVQATIQRNFPTARLLRWDRDTARTRHAHEELLERFERREADILIGTQMIAKGLDLPGVTLVGVVSADIALNMPDYAAAERAFTLLTQVAGRAGRGSEAGHVIIQTFNPQHFCIETASHHDYHKFYAIEIATRANYGYPPFRQFVKFTCAHSLRARARNEALLLYERLLEWLRRLELTKIDIVGPAPAMMERMRGKYRWQLIARGPGADLHRLLRVLDASDWEVDIDPISTL